MNRLNDLRISLQHKGGHFIRGHQRLTYTQHRMRMYPENYSWEAPPPPPTHTHTHTHTHPHTHTHTHTHTHPHTKTQKHTHTPKHTHTYSAPLFSTKVDRLNSSNYTGQAPLLFSSTFILLRSEEHTSE